MILIKDAWAVSAHKKRQAKNGRQASELPVVRFGFMDSGAAAFATFSPHRKLP